MYISCSCIYSYISRFKICLFLFQIWLADWLLDNNPFKPGVHPTSNYVQFDWTTFHWWRFNTEFVSRVYVGLEYFEDTVCVDEKYNVSTTRLLIFIRILYFPAVPVWGTDPPGPPSAPVILFNQL